MNKEFSDCELNQESYHQHTKCEAMQLETLHIIACYKHVHIFYNPFGHDDIILVEKIFTGGD